MKIQKTFGSPSQGENSHSKNKMQDKYGYITTMVQYNAMAFITGYILVCRMVLPLISYPIAIDYAMGRYQ